MDNIKDKIDVMGYILMITLYDLKKTHNIEIDSSHIEALSRVLSDDFNANESWVRNVKVYLSHMQELILRGQLF